MLMDRDGNLSRFCNEKLYNIRGGFTKLLKYIIKTHKLDYIYTFSDNMYSNGELYRSNGFIFKHNVNISYSYTDNKFNVLEHKSKYMKSKIKANSNLVWKEELTEKELMELNNYSRYYDAGKIKWEYVFNK
jgi:hypothetical protein